MGKINTSRAIFGGLVAGIVVDVLGYIVDGILLASKWSAGMQALHKVQFSPSQIIGFNIIGLIAGIVMIWLYAAIRPRYGAGVKTAICAGLAFWFIGVFLPNLGFMWVGALFSHHLMVYTSLGGIVEYVAGAIAGAALYKE
jgi:hypothetical protein